MNLKNFIQGSVFDKIFQISILVIALAALVVRILWFVDIPDLFGDEVSLAENLFNKSFFGYFGKLDIDQAAPPLFLVFTRFFTYFISDFEYSLRVIPFLSSIFSIFAFLALLFKVFKRKSAIIIAFSMFCFLPKILFYSYAFKQYSSDILIFILIMLSYFYLDFNKKDWKFYFLIVLYGVSIWFSYPAIFAFSGVFFVKIIEEVYNKKNFKEGAKKLIYSLPFIVSFILFYILQGQLNSNAALHKYWEEGFLNYNFSNLLNVFNFNFKYFFPDFSFLALIFFIFGFIFVFKNIKNKDDGQIGWFNLLIVVLFGLTLLLSYLHIYPFSMRVSLYFTPVLIIIISSFFEYFSAKTVFKKAFLVIFGGIIMFLSIVLPLQSFIFKTFYIERIETVMKQAKNIMEERGEIQDGILYVADGSRAAAKFYISKRPRIYNFKNVYYEKFDDIKGLGVDEYIEGLNKRIDKDFEKGKTFYYIFTHYPKKQQMLNALYLWAKNKDNFRIYTNNSTFDALIIFSN